MMMVVIIKTLTMYGFLRNRHLNALRVLCAGVRGFCLFVVLPVVWEKGNTNLKCVCVCVYVCVCVCARPIEYLCVCYSIDLAKSFHGRTALQLKYGTVIIGVVLAFCCCLFCFVLFLFCFVFVLLFVCLFVCFLCVFFWCFFAGVFFVCFCVCVVFF